MADTKPSAARLRTAAATLIVAAAVASCSSDPARVVVPAPASSTPATSGDTATADPVATAAPESTPTTPTVAPAVATELSTTATAAPTTSAEAPTADLETTLIALEPSASVPEPALAPATTVTDVAAASWDYSPLADHLSLDAVTDARMQAPNPAVIRIPRLEVEASIIPLGLQDNGSIEVPEDPDQAGWWLGGPEPGETGPAVILGHVDSQEEGPAVFYYLQYLDPGDEIHIDRVDGSTITYVVEATERHNKDEFPTDAVYGPTEEPTLRLVTCGGIFDYGVRSYEDNVIVFASLA